MRIMHNVTAMNSYRNFSTNNSNLAKNLEKLSSGYKINRAGDDAAGLAISEKMRAQITGLEGATKNAKDGISLIQTAEGALTEVHSMLNRMTTLAEQSANGTYQNELDREQLQKEVTALKSEIDRVADSTNFNGLKLLDGSLSDKFETVTTKPSAISEISTEDYTAKGASPAISATYRTNRPEAAASQTSASFTIDLRDVDINVASGNTFTLKVGDKEITATAAGGAFTTAASAAAALVQWGNALGTGATTVNNTGTAGSSTSEIIGATATAANAANKYVNIDGHAWEMSLENGTQIKFTQVDYMGEKGVSVEPKYGVSVKAENTSDTFGTNQQTNWRVENTKAGIGRGTSHQAEVSVDFDFSKLKDGDRFVAGNRTYVFQIGSNSTAATQAATEELVDLTSIFKEDADQLDETKQKQALAKMTETMNGSGAATSATDPEQKYAYSVGNGGVDGNVGTLTFMSQANYTEDRTSSAAAAKRIGGSASGDPIDMRTEDTVMKQFFSERDESGATTTFNLDVTQIKAGDTFTIDGETFEFTDGDEVTTKGNHAINLHDEGIANGIQNSKTNDVTTKVKQAIEGYTTASGNTVEPGVKLANGKNAYAVTTNGGKITLTAKDDENTTSTFENRTAAKIELPTEVKHGEGLVLQIGDTADSYNKLTVSIEDMHSSALGIGDLDVSTQEGAAAALDKIKSAINAVSDTRGNMGALQNRLDHTINNLGVMRENIQSAESSIRDTDVAEEMMTYTKNNILNQSAQAMLAQANQLPQGVLQLLG